MHKQPYERQAQRALFQPRSKPQIVYRNRLLSASIYTTMSDDNKEIITDNEENGSDRNPLIRAAGGNRMADRTRD